MSLRNQVRLCATSLLLIILAAASLPSANANEDDIASVMSASEYVIGESEGDESQGTVDERPIYPATYQVSQSMEEYVAPKRNPDERHVAIDPVPYEPWLATRFGWWGLSNSGSPAGVGEWQGLDSSSPFWDVEGLTSDGYRTLDFFATGTENQSTQAGLYWYNGPGFSVDVDYDRFLHRLGHDRILAPDGGFFDPPLPNGTPGYVMYGTDLNVGQDYAIRVQNVEANFKGRLTDNIRWGLNVWGMKKEGTRQINSTQHCFNQTPAPGGNTCHALTQGQNIDWVTMEIEPVIEARLGCVTLEYSRTMRSFQQNDELVFNNFNSISPTYGLQAVGAYGYVPENYTEIDRLKMHVQVAPCTELYVLGHVGNTHNKFRDSDRKFYGVDARLMNSTFDGLSWTAYAKTFTQNNSADTRALNDRYPGQAGLWLESTPPQTFYNPDSLYLGLADREWTAVGLKGRWLPFCDTCWPVNRWAVVGGYEYGQLQRDNVTYDLPNLVPFTQPNTVTNTFFAGLQQDWSYAFSSFIQYRLIDRDNPLVGVTHREQLSLDAAINSNQPEHEGRIEIGGNWSPSANFLVNAQFWIQNTYNHSEYVYFTENNYPIILTAWYAPNEIWSFSGGYATFSNWIDQDVTLGREDGIGAGELTAWTSRWNYAGRADVLNLGTAYAWNRNLTLTGGFEYVRGWNRFDTPPAPPTAVPDYSDLPGYSAVRVNTYRLVAGVDYEWTPTVSTFFRYNYFDYDDITSSYNSGTSNMFLGGISAVY